MKDREVVVGAKIEARGSRLIPVFELAANLHAADRRAARLGGAARMQLLGLWLDGPDANRNWLPGREAPPDGSKDWSSWLASHPALLSEIARALKD